MKKVTYAFITLLLSLSCDNDDTATTKLNERGNKTNNTEHTTDTQLIGKWNWIKASGGFVGHVLTPESENKKVVLEFCNCVIKHYENGKLVSEFPYSIEVKKSMRYGDLRKMIIGYPPANIVFEIKNNKLYLFDECTDCYQHEYEKIKN
ncbi:hypothetical protein [Flavobacterium poyangense]|uniref:hypothetical protein n=1 Tax=Flavobacterium poyangense TaxID=2204302 RepID=UPI0014229C76|nr:hypothetical protein [Flavobacterium sp. JXAS1]